jgi:hypothetical protein
MPVIRELLYILNFLKVPLFLRKLVLGIPAQASGKNYAAANASGGPSRPASFVGYPTRGIQHHSRNDSTRCESAAIFAKACFGHPSPSKRQKLRGSQCLRRPQPSCFIRWIPDKGHPTSFSQ